jgi:histidine triad (HIT) family protein
MGPCIFCKIINKEIPAKICAESPKTIAFHDISPQAPVHVLVIPREHIPSALQIESSHAGLLAELFETAKRVAKAEGVDESGFRLVINCGGDAGMAVDHLHLHLLGKRKLGWPPG